jgi:hypothetical protein
MAASWKPEDVPADLIEFACTKEEVGTVVWPHELRAILAVVLPEFERMVREQAARDLLDERRKVAEQEGATQRDNDVINGICNGLITAARIVGGES